MEIGTTQYAPGQTLPLDQWATAARAWAYAKLSERAGTMDATRYAPLWHEAAILDRFSCFDLVHSAEDKERLLDMLPKGCWYDPRPSQEKALTRLVREGFLRSRRERGQTLYELNLS